MGANVIVLCVRVCIWASVGECWPAGACTSMRAVCLHDVWSRARAAFAPEQAALFVHTARQAEGVHWLQPEP